MANEKRMIAVSDENIKAVLEKVPYYPDEIWKFTAMTKRFPTVDAVEVKHGRWKKIPYHPYRCSECDEIAPLDQSGEFHYTSNYCPNCGADMRERRTDD